ncbi:MAG: winged helix-turn-helix transcriptional regulator [Chitinophagaceae bacterium]|nr:winged helix-turn-helix transcriptional regulator [Chitinophagaceae bacterium]MCB9044869.1 winged helix-turn-helix transcriptional regulator [Chitinophagales bacterium]
MLETLISSRTRIKLLLRLFLNPDTTAYLRGLADEFDESTNSVRVELNRFEEADMLVSENKGNKKIYKANDKHPLFRDIHNILLKYIGVDRIIGVIIERMGKLEKMYLTGDYAIGRDTGIIDLAFVGEIDKSYIMEMVTKAENMINKKVRFIIYKSEEWSEKRLKEDSNDAYLLLWENKMEKV